MSAWGMPKARRIMSNEHTVVELYQFEDEMFSRYATIGLSSNAFNSSQLCNYELFLCIPYDVSTEQEESIQNFIFDICAYLINTVGRLVTYQDMIPESSLAPKNWPSAVLFDEPRGEPEELECFHVGAQYINLLWVVPIYSDEYQLIKERGIEAFDTALEKQELSVVDTRRMSCVQCS